MFYGHVTLEVYAIVATDNPMTWKCILISERKGQELGYIYIYIYTIIGTENLRPWKCILFSQLKTQRPGRIYYLCKSTLNALEKVYCFRNWKLNAL